LCEACTRPPPGGIQYALEGFLTDEFIAEITNHAAFLDNVVEIHIFSFNG
jgi:hypothetical protein